MSEEDVPGEVGEDSRTPASELKTRIIGEVSDSLVKEVVGTIRNVFEIMNYSGDPPEFVSISQGAVILPSGERIEACYGHDAPKVPGRIYVSTQRSKAAFGNSGIPIAIATSAFAAHEAAEHVNHMRGKTLLNSHRKLKPEEHKAETEDEANRIARGVIEKRYGWTVRFGDENV